jgi:hydroxypyruvate reductase
MPTAPRAILADLFHAAVAAADPAAEMARLFPPRPSGRTIVVGAGKAAAAMARAIEAFDDRPLEGVVVTRYGHAAPCRRIRVLEAAHPEPDAAGLAASEALLEAVRGLTAEDLVIALVSGGGSALLPAPRPPLTLADEIALNVALLASGAPIGVMNLIRAQVSRIKAGRLAAAARPARVVSFVVSDIPGDAIADVASGPTIARLGGPAEALAAAASWGVRLPPAIAAFLAAAPSDAPAIDDPAFAADAAHVVASAALSLEAAARRAKHHGIEAVVLSDSIEGEARDVALMHAAIARSILQRGAPFLPPVALLSGGETTVTVRGEGRGGRNGEFALALAGALAGHAGIHALAADTDGIDGRGDAAGAFADGDTVARLRAAGLDPQARLRANDSHGAFAAIGDLFVTGPTHTNVNDFRAILVGV